jgi:uncharacterized protein YndB with AHSA1/START domain
VAQDSAAASAGEPPRTLARAVEIAAPPERVWELVSDLPGMGRFSPENTGGTWLGGADGPALGARFAGRNASGRRRWSTRCTVVRCEPGRAFAFDVSAGGLPVARWSYELAAVDGGCRLTERWEDRRGRLVGSLGALLTGVADRTAFTTTSLEQTLAAVKEAAER